MLYEGGGGKSKDKSVFGIQFKNSMVGTSSVQINCHLLRLVCSNGMMIPASRSANRVYHSGKMASFYKRLMYCFNEVYQEIGSLQELLGTLGDINFYPEEVAKDAFLNKNIFDIIPGTKKEMCDRYKLHLRYPRNRSEQEKKEYRINHDAQLLELIPSFYKGEVSSNVFDSNYRDNANMFDFLNVFTEYAKSQSLSKKLSIEKKTGELAKYIADKSRRFN